MVCDEDEGWLSALGSLSSPSSSSLLQEVWM